MWFKRQEVDTADKFQRDPVHADGMQSELDIALSLRRIADALEHIISLTEEDMDNGKLEEGEGK